MEQDSSRGGFWLLFPPGGLVFLTSTSSYNSKFIGQGEGLVTYKEAPLAAKVLGDGHIVAKGRVWNLTNVVSDPISTPAG